MSRQISVKPYRRAFRQPLRTAHGEWTTRGFLVRVEQDGCFGYGGVAPLPSFGVRLWLRRQRSFSNLQAARDECAGELALLRVCPISG